MLAAISFDCYGTLVDWEAGISSFLTKILREKGINANPDDVSRAREDIEFEMIQSSYRTYKEVLGLSLRAAFHRFGIPWSDSDGERLADSVPEWPVFSDTKPALQMLGEKYRLVIISNIDNDIIEKTKADLGINFNLTVTAQDAGAYKPSTIPFELALRRLECGPEQVLHVSSGYRYDIPPARKLGFRTAWVNRKHEPKNPGPAPDHEFNTLMELAEFLRIRLS